MSLCLRNLIYALPQSERCTYVKQNCESSYINFYSLHFCTFHSNYAITLPTFIFILIILFFLLSDTCNNYLSVGLTKIVDILKMSQNFAGVTLLALGNGASDVISSLVASSDIEGIAFSIGALIGSGIFVTSFVLGMVVFYGNGLSVNPNMFNRDIILYLVSLAMLIVVGYNGKISLMESLGFLSIYAVNVLLAFVQDCHLKKRELMNAIIKGGIDEDNEVSNEYQREEKFDLTRKEELLKEQIKGVYELDENKFKTRVDESSKNEENEDGDSNGIDIQKGSVLPQLVIKEVTNDQLTIDVNNNINTTNAGGITPRTCRNVIGDNFQLLKLKAKQHYFTYKEE